MEKTLLVIVDFKHAGGWPAEEIGRELEELVRGCRGEVVDKVFCPRDKISPRTLIGEGQVQHVAAVCSEHQADCVIFSHDLKGSQQRNLEEVLQVKTIDRTQLILDIFARHAASQEGKMQVELAQLEYLLPRLVGKGIALSRLGGGIGTLGPGETKLEVDRRRIAQRIAHLKKGLQEVSENRALKRKRRKDKGVPAISLVGYTNAGKSTLLNQLTEAGQVTRDGLFTTLDPLSRQMVLPNHQRIVLSDTVGFMNDLPHHLIESFKATLEEVTEADLLIHVLDISHPNFLNRHDSVLRVLTELEAHEKPMITVLNKIDCLPDPGAVNEFLKRFTHPVAVSAKHGTHIDVLIQAVMTQLSSLIISIDVMLPLDRMDLVNLAHNEGQVFSVKYYNDAVHLRAALPAKTAGLLEKYAINNKC